LINIQDPFWNSQCLNGARSFVGFVDVTQEALQVVGLILQKFDLLEALLVVGELALLNLSLDDFFLLL